MQAVVAADEGGAGMLFLSDCSHPPPLFPGDAVTERCTIISRHVHHCLLAALQPLQMSHDQLLTLLWRMHIILCNTGARGASGRCRLNVPDSSGVMPVHHACSKGSLPVIEALVRQLGSSVHAKDQTGQTCLHKAVVSGSPDVIIWLIEAGADPSTPDKVRKTYFEIIEGVYVCV